MKHADSSRLKKIQEIDEKKEEKRAKILKFLVSFPQKVKIGKFTQKKIYVFVRSKNSKKNIFLLA